MIARDTVPGVDEETVTCLQSLVQSNIDSRDDYRRVSPHLGSSCLKATFDLVARARDENARVLQTILWCNDRTAGNPRSVSSSLHGGLVHPRTSFGDTPGALLNEAMQIEEHLRDQYVDVLDVVQGRAIRQLLQEQLEAVLVSNERIRRLNHVCRAQ